MTKLGRSIITAGLLTFYTVAMVACGGLEGPNDEPLAGGAGGKADDTTSDPLAPSGKLQTFKSAAEFDAFIAALKQKAPKNNYGPGGIGGPLYMANSAEKSGTTTPSITNNQEAGVDEGDIVKAHGKHLVILRRGRLFSAKLGDASLTPVSYIDAFPKGSKLGTWYDEMLIHNNRIVVVGYSYKVSSTEIGLFTIDAAGKISHDGTYFLRSNDYYSSRNYASRLVKGKLVFYMPYFLLRHVWGASGGGGYEASLPGLHPWPIPDVPEGESGWLNIIDKTTIYRPVQPVQLPALHTVVTCDLNQAKLGCTAQGIIGPYARNFYVSKDAVYLWVSQGSSYMPFSGGGQSQDKGQAVVYRLPLDGSNPGAVLAAGSPTDQFSFKEGPKHLNTLVRAHNGGDWMWAPEVTAGDVGLVRIPLAAFSSVLKPVTVDNYTSLTRPAKGYIFQNRFVGDHVLYGTGNGWWNAQGDSKLYVYRYNSYYKTKVTELSLKHSVDRIEVMGKAAVVMGGKGSDLHFSSIYLGYYPWIAGSHVEQNAVQGETRSHGFFYKQTGYSSGILGLPVREKGQGYQSLFSGSARVVYLRVLSNQFFPLGSLKANPQSAKDDKCLVSCVDWYGNARPIFYGGRILALLGYELVEGQIDWWTDKLVEKSRADLSSVLP